MAEEFDVDSVIARLLEGTCERIAPAFYMLCRTYPYPPLPLALIDVILEEKFFFWG